MHIIAMKLDWCNLNLADRKNCQTAKLKPPPNKLCIRYVVNMLQYTVQVDLLASRIFGELVSNRCWRYFNLAKSCSCYTYEAILASFKFGGRTKIAKPSN